MPHPDRPCRRAAPDRRPLRVVVAHEPRAYREALAAALRELRPALDVAVVEPADLAAAVAGRPPDLLVCDGSDERAMARARAWVLLYPGGARRVETSVDGERTVAAGLCLAGLLALVDRVGERVPETRVAGRG